MKRLMEAKVARVGRAMIPSGKISASKCWKSGSAKTTYLKKTGHSTHRADISSSEEIVEGNSGKRDGDEGGNDTGRNVGKDRGGEGGTVSDDENHGGGGNVIMVDEEMQG